MIMLLYSQIFHLSFGTHSAVALWFTCPAKCQSKDFAQEGPLDPFLHAIANEIFLLGPIATLSF